MCLCVHVCVCYSFSFCNFPVPLVKKCKRIEKVAPRGLIAREFAASLVLIYLFRLFSHSWGGGKEGRFIPSHREKYLLSTSTAMEKSVKSKDF